MRSTILFILYTCAQVLIAQQHYDYSVDLTALENDRLTVDLIAPEAVGDSSIFCFPRIVPGIYGVMDHGRLVHGLQAFAADGSEIEVDRIDTNCWSITGDVHRITYSVDDGWEEFDRHLKDIPGVTQGYYRSSEGTFKDSVFVINNNALFGYFDGFERSPIEVRMKIPSGLFAATSMEHHPIEGGIRSTAKDYRTLVDSPILIAPPDTAHIRLNDIDVLVAVHSTSRKKMAAEIATHIKPLLEDQRAYLGGTLPVDRYSFLLYHHPETRPDSWSGDGLEHATSTLILLHSPTDPQAIKEQVYGIASHEFFHTILPIGVHSEEIANYHFQHPEMSKHLWLYEGMTEYFAIHMPIKQGRITLEEFLATIEGKIRRMNGFTDSIPLTTLSEQAMQRQDQYYNFYLKGTLFCMGLDIALRKGSKGEMGVVALIDRLHEKYGRGRPFKDEELFAVIEEMTTPAIGEMLRQYLDRPGPLPLKEWFTEVGIEFDPGTLVLRTSEKPTEEQIQLRDRWIGK